MTPILCMLFSLLAGSAMAEDLTSDIWIGFFDPESELIGYKDKSGQVRVPPLYSPHLGNAAYFKNIAALVEGGEGPRASRSYYLLKDGRKVGFDSLYSFDWSFDCEQEGMIRFRDKKSDRVGFFDSTGKVAISAMHGDASPFNNGYSIVVSDAKRISWDDGEECKEPGEHRCEHWHWVGTPKIINTRNEVLAVGESMLCPSEERDCSPNLYTLRLDTAIDDSTYRRAIWLNGRVVSFQDNLLAFRRWIHEALAEDLGTDRILSHLHDTVIFRREKWKGDDSSRAACLDGRDGVRTGRDFWKLNRNSIQGLLQRIYRNDPETSIRVVQMPSMIAHYSFRQYQTTCSEYDDNRFPWIDVSFSEGDRGIMHTLGFIRGDAGFKLASFD